MEIDGNIALKLKNIYFMPKPYQKYEFSPWKIPLNHTDAK